MLHRLRMIRVSGPQSFSGWVGISPTGVVLFRIRKVVCFGFSSWRVPCRLRRWRSLARPRILIYVCIGETPEDRIEAAQDGHQRIERHSCFVGILRPPRGTTPRERRTRKREPSIRGTVGPTGHPRPVSKLMHFCIIRVSPWVMIRKRVKWGLRSLLRSRRWCASIWKRGTFGRGALWRRLYLLHSRTGLVSIASCLRGGFLEWHTISVNSDSQCGHCNPNSFLSQTPPHWWQNIRSPLSAMVDFSRLLQREGCRGGD